MNLQPRCRLAIYFGNADTHQHTALSAEILQRAHHAGLAGPTTLQGVEGYGHSNAIHTTPRWSLRDRFPVTAHLIDTAGRIRAFLAQLDDVAEQCLIVCDEVEVLVHGDSRQPR